MDGRGRDGWSVLPSDYMQYNPAEFQVLKVEIIEHSDVFLLMRLNVIIAFNFNSRYPDIFHHIRVQCNSNTTCHWLL